LYEIRIYKPTTGAWLSRDPIEESGFDNLEIATDCPKDKLNLFAFVSNDPLNKYDYLGLTEDPICGCSCGPDVTFAVYATFLNVKTVYNGNPNLQRKACRNLRTPWSAPDSWDINSLRFWSWMNPKDPLYKVCKQCDPTVTYKGKCAYADEVNYVLYGYASKLCGYSFGRTRVWMKRLLWLRHWYYHTDTPDSIEQKLAFVGDGYYFDSEITVPSYHEPPCLASTTAVNITHPRHLGTYDISDWRWEPLK
jgi:RHS repeat-associated protein